MFFRRRKQSDFSEEIEAHIRIEADRLRTEGLSESDAQATARRAFGNATLARENFYNRARPSWWDHLWRDLVYGFRSLKRNPAFTATAVLTLALGIGANTALFSVIDAVLIRPLPYPDPGRLAMFYSRFADTAMNGPSPADFLMYKNQSRSFEHLAAFRDLSMNVTGHDRSQRILGVVVTPGFFEVMEMPAQIGRTFTPTDKPGTPIVVLSHSLWQENYAADPNIIGKSIEIDGSPRTVVGVMPAQFRFPLESQAWILSRFAVIEHPLSPFSDPSNRRDTHYFDTVGRLKLGVTLAQAQAETGAIAGRLKRRLGDAEDAIGTSVVNLHEDLVGNTKSALLLLLGGVGLLLLIACANVANILLARGSSRQREIAVRAALGAGRFRIVRQLLTESLLLSLTGAGAAALIAYLALFPLRASIPPEMLLGVKPALDLRVLAFTFAISLICGVVFGIFPALHYSKSDLNETLKGAGRSATSGTQAQRTQSALIISEIAFATVLLISAGLLIRSFRQLLAAPEGFNPRNVLTMDLSFSAARYPTPASRATFVKRTLDAIRELPGITSAAVTSKLPLDNSFHIRDIHIKGRTPRPTDNTNVDYTAVTPDYFRTLGIPLLRGRPFAERDTSNNAPIVIINEAAARRFWPKKDPFLSAVNVGACGGENHWCQIVGIVGDVRQHNLARPPVPAVYVPYARDPWPFFTFVIHTQMDPVHAVSAVETAIHNIDKEQPLFHIRPMRDVVSNSLSARRFRTVLLALFAGLALLLGCIGIYGVMAYAVARRSAEIGIRMALGAEPRGVLLLIIGSGLRRAFAGVLIGALLSLWTTRLLISSLYGVRSSDPITFAATVIVLITVALFATYFPARRATRIDPVRALRAE